MQDVCSNMHTHSQKGENPGRVKEFRIELNFSELSGTTATFANGYQDGYQMNVLDRSNIPTGIAPIGHDVDGVAVRSSISGSSGCRLAASAARSA